MDRKKRKGKIVEDYSRDTAAYANKKALALLLKPSSPTPSNTGSARSFQRDTERGMKIQRTAGTAARLRISIPMCDQGTACNQHWHIRSRQGTIKRVPRVAPDKKYIIHNQHSTNHILMTCNGFYII